jgi:Protein of unknown function (DUF5818)
LLHLAVWDIFRRSQASYEEVTTLKKVVIALVLVLSVFTLTAMAGEWTGYISDSKCGAKGDNVGHADCAVTCVKGGASPVFVTDGKVYKIDDASKVQEHIGHKVTITGELKGDTVQVESVKM